MNIYRHQFVSLCPNNDLPIVYSLEIETEKVIYVEHITTATALHKKAFHEAIADDLLARFGGKQVLKAHHHGVDIETTREKLPEQKWARTALDCRVIVGSRVFEKGVHVQTLVDFLTRDDRYDTYNN